MRPRRPRSRRRTLGRILLALVGLLIAAELTARYVVGLGDPPLFALDPEIEYLLVPNQHCRRFGHDFDVNQWSMRSPWFDKQKAKGANEFRVMVIGDSIVNGGGRIDQKQLATEWLRTKLGRKMPTSKVIVGNISAPSWGPPNELAYAKRFGLFDADVVVIVLNSDDFCDVPGLEYIGSAWPRKKPMLALQELIGVYGWRAACRVLGRAPEPPPPPHTTTHEQDVEACRVAFNELVDLAKASGAKVVVVQYLKKAELAGKPEQGYDAIHEWSIAAGVEPVSTLAAFKSAQSDPYLDNVHANALGQGLLADVILEAVDKPPAVPSPPPTPASPPSR
jgi:hypothetical protein